MFWELYQQQQIDNANKSASRAEARADMIQANLNLLENKIASLALACQSLWELMQEHTDITHKEMLAKMEEVDLRDGKKDGKLSPVAVTCSKCGRRTSRRRPVCLYCGTKNASGELFGLR